ncbi:Pentatricopeptide repeat-containing protein [Lachnellula occidentalis]|uniref:Pentatricopeptide repeat-containing protein n=1 Tax=Lachnellula occidentalis TaxID=215460 RepID=A0A8H8SAN2_9HELO|nr:Pentatricopeptide repeat-containing protein [Lachnellula occidentalis]
MCLSTPSTASNIVAKVASRQVVPFLYPADFFTALYSHSRQNRRRASLQMVSATAPQLEAWFIKSLASAGQCQKHNPKILQPTTFFSSQRPDAAIKRRQAHNVTFSRPQSTRDAKPRDADSVQEPNLTKEELMGLVDQYAGESLTDQLPLLEEPNLYQPSDGPHVTVSDKLEDEWPPPNYTWPADAETKIKLAELEAAVKKKDLSLDAEDLYQLYRTLPRPRAPYLPAKLRHTFLRHLYTVERKDETSMLRYLSVVDDMKNGAIPLTTMEWNSAISFAARYVNRSTDTEVEAALHMFREMEHVAGVKADGVTFNILFDVACKAGKSTLAGMIYKEMAARGIEFDRFHHVSLIQYHGLRRSGDGARAAYKALVESDEIVDTIVLNAMISALIEAGEASAAQNIYERMKKIHMSRHPDAPVQPRNFLAKRRIARVLKNLAKISRLDPKKRDQFQSKSIIAPDLHTYRILINHFTLQVGDLNTTVKLMDEMKWFNVPIHGALFLSLFKGFSLHGGIRYTHWIEARLESVWQAYMFAIDNDVEDLYISQWMVAWVLKAFAKCSGKARTAAVWAEIKTKWQPNEMELEFVMDTLRPLMEGPDAAEKKHDWLLGSRV